jgi:hypothetical protein
LIVIGGAFALSVVFGSSRADVPVRRALEKTLGVDVGKVEISDVAAFTDIDGSSYRTDIVCGSAGKSRRRAFAAVVQYSQSRSSRSYWLKELVIEPPPGRPRLERERELLEACQGPASR